MMVAAVESNCTDSSSNGRSSGTSHGGCVDRGGLHHTICSPVHDTCAHPSGKCANGTYGCTPFQIQKSDLQNSSNPPGSLRARSSSWSIKINTKRATSGAPLRIQKSDLQNSSNPPGAPRARSSSWGIKIHTKWTASGAPLQIQHFGPPKLLKQT